MTRRVTRSQLNSVSIALVRALIRNAPLRDDSDDGNDASGGAAAMLEIAIINALAFQRKNATAVNEISC